ncbi:MAG TPA: hypothetical protein VM686_37320, partial [Polyangiaceae bacterium]|nr:hypothetical protein [Polyangiaceae bacterium]
GAAVVTDVSASWYHTCAVVGDGKVRCWGSQPFHGHPESDVIGDDETPAAVGDVDVGAAVVTDVSASWYHTCAVVGDGKVRCWGNDSAGRLGYGNSGTIGDDETPADAGDVDVGGPVEGIATGPTQTCANLVDGRVRCWGSNEDGELGYPGSEAIGDDETPAQAGDVDVGGFALQVAAGYHHTCVLLDGGTVRCWGNGTGVDILGEVELGGSAVQIVAGLHHRCALLQGGNVRCWGANYNGPLGYGNYDVVGDNETPAEAGDVDVGGTVLQLAAGDYSTCALLEGGGVRCWGLGDKGELGYGNTETIGDDETPAEVGDIDLGGPAVHIEVGFLHACAVLVGGKIRCWGRGGTGALGYGNLEDIGDDETPASAGDVETH